MADKDQELRLSYTIDQAKQKQALKSVSDLRNTLQDLVAATKQLDVTTSGLGNDYAKFSQKAVATRNEFLKGTQAIKDQVSVLQRLKDARAQADGAGSGGGGGGGGQGLGAVGRATNVVGQLASIAGVDTGIQRVGSAASAAAPLLEAMGVSEAAVAAATPIVGAALIALALAAKTATEAIDAGKQRLDNAIESQRTYYQLLYTGTTDSIKAGLEDLKVKLAVTEAVRRDIQAGKDRLKGFGILQGVAEQLTGLTDKSKEADDEIASTQGQIDALTKALGSNQVAANDAKKANSDYAAVLKSKSEDAARDAAQQQQAIQQIQQQAADQEASILQRAADQRVAIAQREAQAETDAYTKLQRDLADGRLKLEQQQADDRLAYQRDEARSAKEHLQNLLKIRKDAQAQEFDLVLNRDFAGIAKLHRDTDQRLKEEDDRYVQEKKQRLEQYKQKLKDDQTAFVREREARIKAYQQQLSDLRLQQQRDLKANDDAARLDLQRLHDKLKAELEQKQAAYTADLKLEADYLSLREQLLHGIISRAQAELAAAGLSSSGGGTASQNTGVYDNSGGIAHHYAVGGWLRGGQTGLVNEKRRESFTSGGQTQMLPLGMGWFTPARSGRVNPNGESSGGFNITIANVNGSTWQDVAKKAGKLTEQKITEAFEALIA